MSLKIKKWYLSSPHNYPRLWLVLQLSNLIIEINQETALIYSNFPLFEWEFPLINHLMLKGMTHRIKFICLLILLSRPPEITLSTGPQPTYSSISKWGGEPVQRSPCFVSFRFYKKQTSKRQNNSAELGNQLPPTQNSLRGYKISQIPQIFICIINL